MLAELMVLPKELSARQWVAYAGLDPRSFESGSSVAKKPRISKAGNKYIDMLFICPHLWQHVMSLILKAIMSI